MKVIFETERLFLREFTLADAALVLALNQQEAVTRYTGDPVHDLEQAQNILEHTLLPQYALYRHGRWAVHLKADQSFIGWCGLKARPERNEIDLGYRYLPTAWGHGYATEAAWASLHYGFNSLGINRIVGRAVPENLASCRVLEKCGMHYVGPEVVDGHACHTYEAVHPFVLP